MTWKVSGPDGPKVYEGHFGESLPEVILKRGQDFDIVVYGIPVATLPHLCPELLEVSPPLRDTHKHVGTTTSVQLQIWTKKYWYEIASENYKLILDSKRANDDFMFYMCAYFVLEDWKSLGISAKGSQYVTFMTNTEEFPPSNETTFVSEKQKKSKEFVISRLENYDTFKRVWPNGFIEGKLDWNLFVDPENRTLTNRLDAQYLRVNIIPSDRLTQFHSGTSKYRITTDGAGFDNIYFTGDWIENGFNCCTEGAITAGLLTAKAISRFPKEIIWEQYIPKSKYIAG